MTVSRSESQSGMAPVCAKLDAAKRSCVCRSALRGLAATHVNPFWNVVAQANEALETVDSNECLRGYCG